MGGLGGGFGGSPSGHREIGPTGGGRKKRSGGLSMPGRDRGGGGGGRKKKRRGKRLDLPKTPAVAQPERPDLPAINPEAEVDPELEAYRDQYGGHLEDLKEGTGFAMDVLTGQQSDMKAAAQEQAMSAAAGAGIPFDAQNWGAEFDRGTNAAMAKEKLGREKMLTSAYQGGLDIQKAPSSERFSRLALDLERDMGEQSGVLDRYKTDVGKYGKDVDAATGSNNALLAFLSSMMGNMSSMSHTGGTYNYG